MFIRTRSGGAKRCAKQAAKCLLLLTLAMVVVIVPWVGSWLPSASALAVWTEVRTEAELRAITADAALAGNYRLMADITLSQAWVPIGSAAAPFTGQFDGNGHTISNLAIVDTTLASAGLFGSIGSGALVENLALTDATITVGSNAGILAGVNAGTISGCSGTGMVSGQNNVGGLVGSNSGTVSDCYARANVSGRDRLGGLIGDNSGSLASGYAASSVAASVFSNYLSFDGNDYVLIPHQPVYATSAFTIEAWFQWDPVNQPTDDVQFVMGKGFEQFEIHTEGGSGQNGVRFIPIGAVGGDSWLDVYDVLQPGWFHVAATLSYDDTTDRAAASIFINGVARDIWQKGTKVGKVAYMDRPTNPLAANTSAITIGRRANDTLYFDGTIADVRVWSRVLTATEIMANKDKQLQGSEPGLVGYWKLNEPDGLVALDATLTGNNGTVDGATRVTGTASNLGGLVGANSGSVSASYYDTEVFAHAGNGIGEGRSTSQMRNMISYSGWDFSRTWAISSLANAGYPYLRSLPTVFAGGTGVSGDPYQISRAGELELMAVKLRDDYANYGSAYYVLTRDIVLPPVSNQLSNHLPIGGSGFAFSGEFDGQAHTIAGLQLVQVDGSGVGLFGSIGAAGRVWRVSLSESEIAGTGNAGGIAAENAGLIEYCHNQGNVFVASAAAGEYGVGGLVGKNAGQVKNSSNSGEVYGSVQDYVGGLIGGNNGGTLQDCCNLGAVFGPVAGGLIGQDSQGVTLNAYNRGSVSGVSIAGGLVGRALGSQVRNCYQRGSAYADGVFGGLVGSAATGVSPTVINHCYWSDASLQAMGISDSSGTFAAAATFADNSGVLSAVPDHDLIVTGEAGPVTLKEALNAWVTEMRTSIPDLEYWHADPANEDGYPYLLAPGELPTFTLTYSASDHGQVLGSCTQSVLLGGNGTKVTAVPATGYQFAEWSDGVTECGRTDLNVFGNFTITANFEPAVPPVAGFGSALQFNGSNYVEVPIDSSHNITNNFTIEFWFRSSSSTQAYVVSRNYPNAGLQWTALYQPSSKQMTFYAHAAGSGYTGTNPYIGSGIAIPDSGWHHFAYSYDGVNWRGYLDGNQAFSQAVTFALGTGDNHLYLGGTRDGDGAPGAFLDGCLDEVRIWKTSLSASTIKAWLFREVDATHPNYADLSNYYQLNEGSGTLVADSASGVNGTLINAVDGTWQDSTVRSWSTNEDTTLTGYLVGSDPDGSSSTIAGLDWNMTFEIISQGSKGTVAIVPGGNQFTYTPDLNATGDDQFSYRVRDSKNNLSDVYTVQIAILPVNDVPGQPGPFTAPTAGMPIGAGDVIDVAWGIASDVENDAITYTLDFYDGSGWTLGVYSGSARSCQFTLPAGLSSSMACFRVRASDGAADSAFTGDTFTVTVPPLAGGDTTVVDGTTGSAISVIEDSVQPEYDNIRLVVPTVSDTVGAAPTSVRILAVDGGILQGSGGSSVVLGRTGTVLPLTHDAIDELWYLNLRFTPDSNRDVAASFQYVLVDADDNRLNSLPSTATIPITPVNDQPSFGVTQGDVGDGFFCQFYRTDWNLTGTPSIRVDEQIYFDTSYTYYNTTVWGMPGVSSDMFSVRWSGSLKAPISGYYRFQTRTDDGARLWVNGQLLIDHWVVQAPTIWEGGINLVAGNFYDIRLEYYERGGGETCRLSWIKPGDGSASLLTKQYVYSGFIGNQTMIEDGVLGPLAFSVSDVETAVGSLVLSASSSNTILIPNANIVFTGAGSNRSVTITPTPNQYGTATITVTLSDGTDLVQRSFTVQVTALPRYTVTFKNWDGSPLGEQSVKQGTAATAPTDPTRVHYRFVGWDKSFANVTSALVVTATYEYVKTPITVTAVTQSKVYGSPDPTLSYTITAGALESGDSLTGALTRMPGENAGDYAILQGTLSAGEKYELTFVGASLTVEPAALTVRVENRIKTYGDDNPGFSATYAGFVLGQDASALGGTLAFSTPATASSNVGTYAITPSGLTSDNYAISFVNGTLQVNQKALTVKAEDKSKTYGDANPDFTVTYSGFVLGQDQSALGGTLAFNTPATASSNVGSYAIAPSGLTSSNYAITFVDGTLLVNKKALTVKADDKSKTYGDANPEFTVSYDGFVLGQDQSALGGTLAFNTPATASSNVGSYAIAPSGLTSSNYAITFVDGTLLVNKKALTVKAEDKSKTYGEANPDFTVTYEGFVLDQTPSVLGGSLAFSTDATANSGVGTYAITPAGLTSSNYAITFVDGRLQVNPKALTVKADDKSKTYGDVNPTFTVTYEGFVLDQTPSVLGGTLAFSTDATASSDVGSYAITPAGLTSSNYAITFVDGTLQVNRKALTVRAEDKSKAYGDANPDFTVTYSGFVLGQDQSALGGTLAFNTPATASSNAGSYAIAPSGLTSSNYAITFVDGTLQVNKKALTVKAEDKSKTYGDANPTFAVNYEGFVLDQTRSVLGGTLALNTPATVSSDVGSYAITPSGLTSGNYAISFVDGTLQVNQKALTVKAVDKSKTYGEANPDFAVTYDGFVLGQTSSVLGGTLAFNTPATASSNVGSYAITPSGLTSSNYAITFVNGTLQVNQKALAVKAVDKSKTYGEANPDFAVTYDGLVLGQSSSALGGTLAFNTPATASSNVGSYAITPSGLTSSNYAISFLDGTLQVNQKALAVKAEDRSKTYGDANPEFAVNYEGFVLGQNPSALGGTLAFNTPATASSNVGSYAITPSGLTSGNYAISFVNGTLEVNQKALAVKAEDRSKTYGDANPEFAVSYEGFVLDQTPSVLGGTLAFNTPATASSNVGSYAITPSGLTSSNYAITFVDGMLQVNRRALTVTADTQNKVYGDPEPELSYAISSGSLFGSDSLSGGLTRDAGENVGAYLIRQGTLDAGSNYDLTYVAAELAIGKRPITITANSCSKTYGNPDPELRYQITGTLVGSDTLHGALERESGSDVGDYLILLGTLDAGTNYDLSYVAATLSISPKTVKATGIIARDKLCDATAAASLDLSAAGLSGVRAGDDVSLDVSGARGYFADAGLGKDKTVAVGGLVLRGSDADNYRLAAYTTTADIVNLPGPDDLLIAALEIIVNGESQGNLATGVTTVTDNRTVTRVTLDDEALSRRLEQAGEHASVIIPISTGAGVVQGELTGQMVKDMEEREAVLEIRTDNVSYVLPAEQINIDSISAQAGSSVDLREINVRIQVASPGADTMQLVQNAANRGSYQLVVSPVEFDITATHGDQTIEVSRFSGYVERTVAIPDGVDPSRITTGVVLNSDGTFSHVPTTVFNNDGRYYARINSLSNSTYTVIWNPLDFEDMEQHWAEAAVEDMCSRLVMVADSDDSFGPNRAITRVEFAETLVKALGLLPEVGSSPFVDISADNEHLGYILTACDYNLMHGYPDDTFRPNSSITREEAMSMVVAAMRVTKLESGLQPGEGESLLATYADGDKVGSWARGVVAACLKSGVIGGRPGKLIAPKDKITRAEAAAIVQRLLRQSNLI